MLGKSSSAEIKVKALFFETSSSNKDKDLCHLVEFFAERMGLKIHIVTSSTLNATSIDRLLWTFKKDSFLPHKILARREDTSRLMEKVFITVGTDHVDSCRVLIQYDDFNHDLFLLYPISLFFVVKDIEEQKQKSRALWKLLGASGIEKHHFPLVDLHGWFYKLEEILEKAKE